MGKVEDVIEGLKNMHIMVGDTMSSLVPMTGYDGVKYCGEKSRDDGRLGSTQSGTR